MLAYHGAAILRTHDLEELQDACIKAVSSPDLAGLKLEELSGYAVELRYDPEFWPGQDTAAVVLTLANRARPVVVISTVQLEM